MVASLHFSRNSLNGIVYISDSLIYPVKILIKKFRIYEKQRFKFKPISFYEYHEEVNIQEVTGTLIKESVL